MSFRSDLLLLRSGESNTSEGLIIIVVVPFLRVGRLAFGWTILNIMRATDNIGIDLDGLQSVSRAHHMR